MMAAVEDEDIRPGMVAVIQTFAQTLRWNPHIHALGSRGGWNARGQWIPLPYIDAHAAELLFRHKVFQLLKNHGLLSDERIELLLSWKKHTGFSVDNSVNVYPSDKQGLEDNPLFSHPQGETLDIFEFIARVLTQIPEPRTHGVRYFGAYSSRTRVYRKKTSLTLQSLAAKHTSASQDEPKLSPKKHAALKKSWAQLIRRVYQVDPLKCDCGGTLRVISFITEQKVIRKILDHLEKRTSDSRAPPKT
jgi:hypothetical protein